MKKILYYIFKVLIKTQFFFYTKRIKIQGTENIPKEGAILFTANHPNGLLDPILIASSIKRKTHFLVQAAVFKNNTVSTFFGWLGMMPVYRIRDGIRKVTKNNLIFDKCRTLLKEGKVLLIFPEGTHNRKRTIRPLSKGFTRIVFGSLDESPDLKIHIIPVGITYQNSSKYPSEIALQIGKPILVNDYYKPEELYQSTLSIKKEVSEQLQKLTVHINDNEQYSEIEQKLNNLAIDYTNINETNKIIASGNYSNIKPKKKQKTSFIKFLVIANSFIPYTIWKLIHVKIKEVEFIDTYRLCINTFLFPFFYSIQAILLSSIFNFKIGFLYFIASLLLVAFYTKTAE